MTVFKNKPTRVLIIIMVTLVILGILIARSYYGNINDSIDPRVKEAREQKEKLEAQTRQYPEKVTDSVTRETQPPIQNPENQSAMEEALEALRQAEAAFEASEQELAGYLDEKVEMEDHIKHTRDLFVQATEDPNKLDALYEEYSPVPQKSDQR